MANTSNIQQNAPNWGLILKIAIAVLTAIAGAVGAQKSEVVQDLVNGISTKKGV